MPSARYCKATCHRVGSASDRSDPGTDMDLRKSSKMLPVVRKRRTELAEVQPKGGASDEIFE